MKKEITVRDYEVMIDAVHHARDTFCYLGAADMCYGDYLDEDVEKFYHVLNGIARDLRLKQKVLEASE